VRTFSTVDVQEFREHRLKNMQKQTLVDRLNHIANLFCLGLPSEEEHFRCDIFGSNLEFPLSLIGENRNQFQAAVDDLLNSFSAVKGTVSRELVIKELIPLIRERKANGYTFGSAEADEFEQTICGLPLQRYRVLRPIYGVEMAPEAAPVRFGDFEIDFGRQLLISNQPSILLASVLKPEDQNRLFIQCGVAARDTAVAFELADALFYRFELIFRFLIGCRTDWVEVGIVNYRGAQMRDRFVFSEDGHPVEHGSAWNGAMQSFIFGDSRFPTPTPPLIRLFELITRPNNEFEKHIIRCAEWTGQAIGEPNEAAALVKAAIALEVLFSANEKGLITPSIMAQISESCAFLLGNEHASPVEIEREVKHLYGVRSSVVHSGKDSVDSKDLDAFIRICRHVVILLLSGGEFVGMDTMAKLADYFRSRKYAILRNSEPPSAKRDSPNAIALDVESPRSSE
jgi:hypothetical protein